MKIIDCEQRTEQWEAIKRGVPSASEFGDIVTPAKGLYSTSACKYIGRLIDDIVRPGVRRKFGGNAHTERGNELEPEARAPYEFERDTSVREVGFVLTDCGRFGCSPDAMTEDHEGIGGAEIKSPDGPTHVSWILEGGLPNDHKAQVHGNIIVTGSAWWDFLSYCPGYERILVRVYPDQFTDQLRSHLERFHNEYKAALAKFGLTHPSEV